MKTMMIMGVTSVVLDSVMLAVTSLFVKININLVTRI